MAENFVHLHTHSSYSLLDGQGTVKKILDRAKELGQTAMAITDHGNMYGVIEFYEYAKQIGIKPILGARYMLLQEPGLTRPMSLTRSGTT